MQLKSSGRLRSTLLGMVLATQLSSCGGGGESQLPTVISPPSAPADAIVEIAISPKNSQKWTNAPRIEARALVESGDGGFWIAGALTTPLNGSSFLKKVGGLNACGQDGYRELNELVMLLGRPNVQVAVRNTPNTITLGGTYGGGLFVAEYEESTCLLSKSFANAGVLTIAPPVLTGAQTISLAVDSQSRIYIAASYSGNLEVRRFKRNGALDVTYADGGTARSTANGGVFVNRIKLSPSGEAYIVGYKGLNFGTVPSILKFDANGKLAKEFGTLGIAVFPVVSKGTGLMTDFIIEQSTLILIGNTAVSPTADDAFNHDSFILSVNTLTGEVTPEFAVKGYARWDWGYGSSNMIFSIAKDRSGNYLTCGHRLKGFNQSITLAKFRSNGLSADASGIEGRLVLPDTTIGQCSAMLITADDRIAVTGFISNAGYYAEVVTP